MPIGIKLDFIAVVEVYLLANKWGFEILENIILLQNRQLN